MSLNPESLFLALQAADFPAQAIIAHDPSKRNRKLVVVDQDPENHKTYVIACALAARKLGLHAGMPLVAARRRCPRMEIVFRNVDWEAALSEKLRSLSYRYTPEFEVRAGHGWLDLTGTPAARALSPDALARQVHGYIRKAAKVEDLAVGMASTRLMAKVMARLAQERSEAVGLCPAGREAEMLAPLDPGCLPGLSPACRERIRRYALSSIGQIHGLGRQALATRFGAEGDKLHTLASGLDLEEIRAVGRGVSAETVLAEDVNDDDVLSRKVRLTADRLVFHLRKGGLQADRLIMTLRHTDGKAVRKTVLIHPRTDDFRILAARALEVFRALYQRRVALRSIALKVPTPDRHTGQQSLFTSSGDHRQKSLGDALAKIRSRSGFGIILSGANVDAE